MRNKYKMLAVITLILSGLYFYACTKQDEVGTTPRAGAAAWKDMNKEQRIEYMKTQVMPKMMALFQAHDAEEFKEFTCMTCHGEGAKVGKFDMPNPKLPELQMAGNFKAHKQADVKFMMMKVVPTMAKLLGTTPFDMQTKTGFGCGNCHKVKM